MTGTFMNTVVVECHKCKAPLRIGRDELRQLVDEGKQPECAIPCVPLVPPLPLPKPKRAIHGTDPATAAGVILSVMTPGKNHPLTWIVVAAWEADMQKFGLSSYHDQYPDSNRVYTEIVKMARPGGPLERTAPRTYRRKVVDTAGAVG